MVSKILLPIAALGALLFAVYHVVTAQQVKPKLEPPVEPSRNPFGRGVAGAGLVEAATENIAIGCPLPGVVLEVFVRVGDRVEKDQPLFRVDDRHLQKERLVRQANLASARAQLEKMKQVRRKEELPPARAKVAEARANLADMEDQFRRAGGLYQKRVILEEEMTRREQAARVARAQLEKAEADLALLEAPAWQPDLDVAQAAVLQAQAALEQTLTEIERTRVTAPLAGQVLQNNVRPGEYVGAAPGQALLVLGDITCKHIRVDIDEYDIPRFQRTGQARAMLRGAPQKEYHLRFVRVEPYVIPKKSLTGDNTERVDTRVLQVIYALEDSSAEVFVGQQVDVYVADRGE